MRAVVLAALLALSCAGCSGEKKEQNQLPPKKPTVTKDLRKEAEDAAKKGKTPEKPTP